MRSFLLPVNNLFERFLPRDWISHILKLIKNQLVQNHDILILYVFQYILFIYVCYYMLK